MKVIQYSKNKIEQEIEEWIVELFNYYKNKEIICYHCESSFLLEEEDNLKMKKWEDIMDIESRFTTVRGCIIECPVCSNNNHFIKGLFENYGSRYNIYLRGEGIDIN